MTDLWSHFHQSQRLLTVHSHYNGKNHSSWNALHCNKTNINCTILISSSNRVEHADSKAKVVHSIARESNN